MKNLAGHKEATAHVRQELSMAGISIIDCEPKGEVASLVYGELNGFIFERLWYYYSVRGQVPVQIAMEMYAHLNGKEDVRAWGDCAAPRPNARKTDFIDMYHIDTEAGLRLFVETIRKYNLHADGSWAKPETATA